jgi:Zn-dependent M28 family amino/carboxypeptidase
VRELLALTLSALLCAAAVTARQQTAAKKAAADDVAARFKSQVETISAGEDTAARRAALEKRISGIQHNYGTFLFKHGEREGANVVVHLPRAAGMTKTLLLGAHYDRVARGRGAVDNASGCAAVLELLAAFKARPLRNYSVGAVFFDYEEAGLVGSKAFVASDGVDGVRVVPDVFVNFDVFGYGDTLYAMSPKDDAPLARAFRQAAADAKFPLVVSATYPPSDHLSFLGTRAEVASVSIVGGEEIAPLTQLLRGERPAAVPRALSTIHTGADTPDKIDAAAAARALAVVERALRLLDSPQP